MKTLDDKKVIKKDLPPENQTEFKIDIQEYDESTAYLEIPEELDEKTVSYIEKEVRSSFEYRNYISYLKNELNLTKCSMMPGIDITTTAVSLEFHHYPMNLFEITEAIGKQMLDNSGNKKISCFDIAEKVVEEHYRNNIGLVPLTKTMHDMAHNRSIIIPISKVNGNYKQFIKKYKDYIDQDILDRVAETEITSESDDAKAYNNAKLEKNISTYDITYYKKSEDDDNE